MSNHRTKEIIRYNKERFYDKLMSNIKRCAHIARNTFTASVGTIIKCPKCGSYKVSYGKTEINDGYETYPVVCRECYAKGIVCEYWGESEAKGDDCQI